VQRVLPELRVAFDLGEPLPLAWAFPMKSADESLYQAALEFFEQIRANGELEELLYAYYGHIEGFDYMGARTFLAHIEQRLPLYREAFEEAASQIQLDWRLLAAMGYQESHWDPGAVSPTGVRGIMMLTRAAAAEVGVEDRVDPLESIFGGARYFAGLKARLPERIREPDRTWLALAAYNIGLGHVEDARRLTQLRGGDPDRWLDVKESLPLLTQKEWYERTRFGFARGWAPVRYVEAIRSYYDILVRSSEEKGEEPSPWPPASPAGVVISAPALSAM
jgi:membrane-bound lytic murein transglycosylase F